MVEWVRKWVPAELKDQNIDLHLQCITVLEDFGQSGRSRKTPR